MASEMVEKVARAMWAIDNPGGKQSGVTEKDMGDGAAFAAQWNLIHHPRAWDDNPWVVVTIFKPHLANVDDFIREMAA